jgi:hypothetical protein
VPPTARAADMMLAVINFIAAIVPVALLVKPHANPKFFLRNTIRKI